LDPRATDGLRGEFRLLMERLLTRRDSWSRIASRQVKDMDSFLRNYATPLSFVAFLAAGVTGVMLFLGVGSRELGDLHEWLGLIFVAAMILHFVRNWRGMLAMLSAVRAKAIVTGLGTVAAVLIAVYGFGVSGGGHGGGHGGGPHRVMTRLASAPIAKLAPALGMTSDQAIARLKSGGVAVEGPEQSLADIADNQSVELPRLLNLVLREGQD
jgi:hypothetical protein